MNKTIYYNDKKIAIYEKKSEVITNQDLLIDFDNITIEFREKLFGFFDENNTQNLNIVANDTKDVYKELKKFFDYIEAAGGLIQKNNSYLFIKRLGKWDLPKGKLDPDETSKNAAIRECEEECAVSGLTIIEKLESTYHIYLHKGKYKLKKTFWYLMNTNYEGKLIPQTEENIEEVVWFTKEEIREIVFKNTYPTILGLVKKSLKI